MARKVTSEILIADAIEETGSAEGSVQHRIPVIDKMFQIMDLIRLSDGSATINNLAAESRVPRSTVYRILNTLAAHNAVSRGRGGVYRLGFRLVGLAAAVDTTLTEEALAQMVRPALQKLAADTGETSKLTVVKNGAAEVLDMVLSPKAMAPSSRIGSRFRLHAGAASKVLLAFSPQDIQESVLSGELEPLTRMTITDPAKLRQELETIRQRGVSYDRGEWSVNVNAIGAPILDFAGRLAGALSIAYFADPEDREMETRMVEPLLAAARAASALLGHSSVETERTIKKSRKARAA